MDSVLCSEAQVICFCVWVCVSVCPRPSVFWGVPIYIYAHKLSLHYEDLILKLLGACIENYAYRFRKQITVLDICSWDFYKFLGSKRSW